MSEARQRLEDSGALDAGDAAAEAAAKRKGAAVELEWVREYAYDVKPGIDSYFLGVGEQEASYNVFSSRITATRKTFPTRTYRHRLNLKVSMYARPCAHG